MRWFGRRRTAGGRPAEPPERDERQVEEVRSGDPGPQPELGRSHRRVGERLALVVVRPGSTTTVFEYDPTTGGFGRATATLPGEEVDPEEFWRAVADRRLALLRTWAERAAGTDPRTLADVHRAVGAVHHPMPLGAATITYELWGRSASVHWRFAGVTFRRDEIERAFGAPPDPPVYGPGGGYAVASTPDLVTGPRPVRLVVKYPGAQDPAAPVLALTMTWSG